MKTNTNATEDNRNKLDAKLRQRVEKRAYHLWLESGCGHGDHERHWLQAERELMKAAKHEDKPQSDARRRKKTAGPH